jgi:hypothetical protein
VLSTFSVYQGFVRSVRYQASPSRLEAAARRRTIWQYLLNCTNQIVITLDYRDCGAARIAYGAESIADPID